MKPSAKMEEEAFKSTSRVADDESSSFHVVRWRGRGRHRRNPRIASRSSLTLAAIAVILLSTTNFIETKKDDEGDPLHCTVNKNADSLYCTLRGFPDQVRRYSSHSKKPITEFINLHGEGNNNGLISLTLSCLSSLPNEALNQEKDFSSKRVILLRDILDLVFPSQSGSASTSHKYGREFSLEKLEIVDCPVDQIQRLDFLYLSSSLEHGGSALRSLTVRGSRNETYNPHQHDRLVIEADALTQAPPRLQSIDWSSNGLESVPSLCPVKDHLRSLDLSSNSLRSVPRLTFEECGPGGRGMRVLENLNLSGNRLRGRFDPTEDSILASAASNLTHLDLSYNGITSIAPTGLFSRRRASKLTVLKLSGNRLSTLPANLLGDDDRPLRLRELYLSDNKLVDLPAQLLRRLTNLAVLNVSGNSISRRFLSGSSPLSSLRSLVALDLSANDLDGVDESFFVGLSNLQVLTVARNRLTTLDARSFLSTPSLKALVLSENDLEHLEEGIFDGLKGITSLAVDHNNIKSLPRNLFSNCCEKLKDLSLHSNHLRHIPHPALSAVAPHLRTLDLGENNITDLHPNALSGMDALYGLRLAGNRLTAIKGDAFKHAAAIEMLNLADNQIVAVEQTAFQPLKKLKALRLDNNGLDDINGLLTVQHHLQWLNVSHNRLQWFDYAFIPKSLLWLNLAQNEIEEVGNYYEMTSGFSLIHLDLSGNKLVRLDRQNLLHSLREISLQNNAISEVAANTFLGLANLTKVDLRSNQIEKFASINSLALSNANDEDFRRDSSSTFDSSGSYPPAAAAALTSDETAAFDLHSTAFAVSKPSATKAKLLAPAEMELSGNPLKCDCDMEWIQRINDLAFKTPRSFLIISDWSNLTCSLNNRLIEGDEEPSSTTTELADQRRRPLVVPVSEVKPSEFLCEYEKHCFALCMCCDFFACDCRMKCSEGCDCYHDQTWSANIIQCGRQDHPSVPEFIPMDATSVYLDGNNLTDLSADTFVGRKHLTSLYLNSSHVTALSNKTFSGLDELLILHLDRNDLVRFEGGEFADLVSLEELHLDRNSLRSIPSGLFANLNNLKKLSLDHNRLATFPVWTLSPALETLTLSENRWTCECGFLLNFQRFVTERRRFVADINGLECRHADAASTSLIADNAASLCADVQAVSFRDLNSNNNEAVHSSSSSDNVGVVPINGDADSGVASGGGLDDLVPTVAVVAAAIVIVISLIILAVAFRKPVSMWLRSKSAHPNHLHHHRPGTLFDHPIHNHLNSTTSSSATTAGGGLNGRTSAASPTDANKYVYQAYVHHHVNDSRLAEQNVLPHLPGDAPVFLHHRDASANSAGKTDALLAVSRCVIFLVSRSFYQTLSSDASSKTLAEMRAIMSTMASWGRLKDVLVLAVTLEDKQKISAVLSASSWPESIHVLSFDEDSFWQKLQFLLPPPPPSTQQQKNNKLKNLSLSTNDETAYSKPEDDLWTYVKAGSSSSTSTTGCGGLDSSTASNHTLQQQKFQRPGVGHQTLQPQFNKSLIMNPFHTNKFPQQYNNQRKQQQFLTTTHQPPGSATSSRRRIMENPLHDSAFIDSDYQSVFGEVENSNNMSGRSSTTTAAATQSRNNRHLLKEEPIYHTLEPVMGPPPPPQPLQAPQSIPTSPATSETKLTDSKVYINADLEVVYPRVVRQAYDEANGLLFSEEPLMGDFIEDDSGETSSGVYENHRGGGSARNGSRRNSYAPQNHRFAPQSTSSPQANFGRAAGGGGGGDSRRASSTNRSKNQRGYIVDERLQQRNNQDVNGYYI